MNKAAEISSFKALVDELATLEAACPKCAETRERSKVLTADTIAATIDPVNEGSLARSLLAPPPRSDDDGDLRNEDVELGHLTGT